MASGALLGAMKLYFMGFDVVSGSAGLKKRALIALQPLSDITAIRLNRIFLLFIGDFCW